MSQFDFVEKQYLGGGGLVLINNTTSASSVANVTFDEVFSATYKNYKIIDIANTIVNKIPNASIETTPMKFQDARNYQVSSEKLFNETGFRSEVELLTGVDEVYSLISSNRIKNVNHVRYSNQNFLEKYGIN